MIVGDLVIPGPHPTVPGLAIVRPRTGSADTPVGNGPMYLLWDSVPGLLPNRRAITGSPQVRGEGRAHRVACRRPGMNAPGADVPGGGDRPCVMQSYVPVGAPSSPSADSIEFQDAGGLVADTPSGRRRRASVPGGHDVGRRRRGRPAWGNQRQRARNGNTGRRAPQAGRGSLGAGRNCARDRGIRPQQAEYRACV